MPKRLLICALAAASACALGGCADEKIIEANPEHYVGVGVELTIEAAGARLVRVLDGSPAAASGLSEGDVILEIDATPTRGQGLAEIVSLLRGPAGSEVRVLARTSRGNRRFVLRRRPIDNR